MSNHSDNKRYRRTIGGLITNLYHHMNERSIKHGWGKLYFPLDEFRAWIMRSKRLHKQYAIWVESGYEKGLRPSIDRVDVLGKYTYANMQILPAKENRDKGDKEKRILWGKPISQYDLDGKWLADYSSIMSAVEITKIKHCNISRVLVGQGKTTGGYKWSYRDGSSKI